MEAFSSLKNAFTQTPLLQHSDPDQRSFIEVDSIGWADGGILLQFNDQTILHPVAILLGCLNAALINYEIYDKEQLAVVTALSIGILS